MNDHSVPLEKGQVLVLCAPSGAGKSTLIRKLRTEFPNIGFSVSCTTRKPRDGEVDGRDYHFLSEKKFLHKRDDGDFAEWAQVHGNYYGTPRKPVEEMLLKGTDILFDIDFQGAMQLRDTLPEGLFVFLMPPSFDDLERRLRGRGSDPEEVIERRLNNARAEMAAAAKFDYWIVNDDLERAYSELRAVYLAGRTRRCSRPGLLENILSTWD